MLCPGRTIVFLLFCLVLLLPAVQQAQEKPGFENEQLEAVENLSESLANDLLEFSVAVRQKDFLVIAEFIPDAIQASPYPVKPLSSASVVKWIHQHSWLPVPAVSQNMPRSEFLESFRIVTDHFSEIEDARFKVKQANFDDSSGTVPGVKVPTAAVGSRGRARLAFFIIGRNGQGQREWMRGTANVGIHRAPSGRWQFESFALLSLDCLAASTDLFSEVSIPAGVAATRPAYGSPGNSGFVWHGATAADFDNDGWIDLFVTGPDRNFLYLNDHQGRFWDAAEPAGLAAVDSGVAPLALDYDNDGDQDVFLSAVGPQILLENRLIPDGRLTFRDVSLRAGVNREAVGFSAVAGDVNGDGRPDIYVTGYNHYGHVLPDSWFRATNGTPNLLFIHQGDGRFREEAPRWGVEDRRWSYAAAFADVNGDGRLDLYVANDFGENGLYINRSNRFVDEARERGVLDPGYGMGVSFGDYNNDGLLDMHVTNMSSTAGNRILARLFPASSRPDNVLIKIAGGNSLFENLGRGYFRDVTTEAGSFSAGWAWGGGFLDFDNDGWEDLFIPNGFISGKSMNDT